MRGLVKIVLAGCLLLSTSVVLAQDAEEEEKRNWEGTGEFGFVSTTGNTESEALNLKLGFTFYTGDWSHRFGATALMTSEDGIQDNERYTAELQSNRALNEKSWLFGVLRFDADKFGSYDPQMSLSAGYGRQLMKSEKHELIGEIGVGYRSLEERVTGNTSEEIIGRFLLDDNWQIWQSTKWTNRLLVETGSSNTFTQFNTGLTVSMTEKFAIKLGYELRHNTDVPQTIEDNKNTDTVTSANLVYNF